MTDGVKEQMVGLSGIGVPIGRMRRLRPELVDKLAKSIKVSGLLQPIILRPPEPLGQNGFWLIAGRHRFEAAKKLKWQSIRAEIKEGISADLAELIEIDENLIRADLTPSERATHHAKRKELHERLNPQTKHGGDRRSKRQNGDLKTYTEGAAAETGQSRRTVERDVMRGTKVKVLADIIGTSLDQGDELDALAKLPEEEQRNLADRAKAGEKVTAKTVVDVPPQPQIEPEATTAPRIDPADCCLECVSETIFKHIQGMPTEKVGRLFRDLHDELDDLAEKAAAVVGDHELLDDDVDRIMRLIGQFTPEQFAIFDAKYVAMFHADEEKEQSRH